LTHAAIKRIGLVRKKASMTQEAFVAHWLGTHAALCAVLPGMLRYSVNLVDRSRFPDFGYDGFSELWFKDEAALAAALASPEGKTLLADLPNFVDGIDPLIVYEHQIRWP
jgi:uncharacterized protein (TIGR02118 family)